jgi:hypothetical protein
MELNRKLTHLLKGRTIQSESGDEDHVAITFDDESTLKLRVAGQATVSVGAKVEAVHEASEHFQVDLDEGASVQVQLADPGSSVALRDKSGAVQSSANTTRARNVVAIIRCHSKVKGNKVSRHPLPTKRRQPAIVAKTVVFATD